MKVLNKKHIDLQRNQSLWKSRSPPQGEHCGYFGGCCNWLSFKCCGPCRETVLYDITTRGIKQRTRPGCCFRSCQKVSSDFVDFRFLKDIEVDTYPECGCCFTTHSITIYSDDVTTPPIHMLHPQVGKLEKIVRDN